MALYPHSIPRWIQALAPGLTWHIPTPSKEVYLTFDDGPHPTITPWVMDQLEAFGGKGTFFMVGNNVDKYPEVAQAVVNRGHSIGNHTYHHLKGWNTNTDAYLADVAQAAKVIPSALFRPPYGRISRAQIKALQPQYRIVMWEVLTGDFDRYIQPHDCTRAVLKHTRPGSVVVYHDSDKSWNNLRASLPAVLRGLTDQGYVLKAL
jgi:peptidoglycan/xylan/chitin deacetylase (PgdA/CDA1 family)